jgi:hypothetical protein
MTINYENRRVFPLLETPGNPKQGLKQREYKVLRGKLRGFVG